MKISKNILLGLGILSALVGLGLVGPKASAATPFTADELSKATYKYVNGVQIEATIGGNTYNFVDKNPFDGTHNYKPQSAMFCSTTKGLTIDLSFDSIVKNGGDSVNGKVDLDYKDSGGSCQSFQKAIVFTKQADGSIVAGASTVKKGDPCSGGKDCGSDGTCQVAGGDCTNTAAAGTESPCEANAFGFSLTWMACPVLDAASGLSNALLNVFEDQLSFSVDQLGSGQAQVYKSWALIRDLSTSLIVIITLVMIISQAFSFGPFDAYTIRKMLPRIVAAVIFIQISWIGVSWLIDVVNAIARSIADILYYPFGGPDNMNLFALMGHAKIGGVTAGVLDWAAVGVAAFLAVAFLFTMLGIALVAIIGLFAAVLTLIFRKILIIVLLIFAPLALLAWILPGTERYWKMWRENLTKVLFMYPIAVAIIAAGRVFAYVVGDQPGNGGEFVALLFILVGFFGPLFILPKTFKWGGQAMGMVSGAISNAGTKVGAPGKKFFGTRQEGWSGERKRRSQERYTHDVGFSWRKPWQRPVDLVRSGQIDPTLTGRRKRQAMTAYSVAGHESEENDIKSANTIAQMMIQRTHPDEQDDYARALAAGQKVKVDSAGRIMGGRYVAGETMANGKISDGGELKIGSDFKIIGAVEAQDVSKDLLQRRAGLDQAARLGGDGNIEFIQKQFEQVIASHDPHEIEMMNQFTTANVQSLFSKLPHIYKNNNYADPQRPQDFNNVVRTVNGLNPNDMTALSGPGMKKIRDSLLIRSRAGDAESIKALRRLAAVFDQTTQDASLKGRIPSEVTKAMHSLTTRVTAAEAASWGINTSLASIASRTDAEGIVR